MISVIMPYYNKKKFVEGSLKSVLNQTYKNFEVIIVYDDEEKKDLQFIQNLTLNDDRIKLIINDKNIGAGPSRNKGIKFSKGEYLAFIDSDDTWCETKLEEQINYLQINSLDFIHTSYIIIDELDNNIGYRTSKKKLNFNDLLNSCDIGLSTVLMKKELINQDICFGNTKTKEDYILWLKLAKIGVEINLIDKRLSCWRKSKNSLSSSIIQKILDGFVVYNKYMKFNFFKSFFLLLRLSFNSLLR
tara:strand:+ start:60 stop:794 length:735 start_codon:yes stop_codon:yes gene_type:complete